MTKILDNLNINNKPNNRNIVLDNGRYLLCAIILLFISFRIFKYLETEYFIIWFDSAQFAATSLASIWTKEFWSDGIPPLYPFFLKYFQDLSHGTTVSEINFFSIFSYYPKTVKGIEKLADFPYYLVKDNFNIITASVFQLFFSISSCIVFALSFCKIFENIYIKLTAATFVLILGMESSITLWDKHILTESIAISLLLLTISFLIHIKYVASKYIYLIPFIFILISLSFIKITNNYLLLFLIPFILFHFRRSNYKNKFNYTLIISTLFSLFIFNQYMLFNGDRSQVPMKDLISSRISSEGFEDVYDYFRRFGMPELPEEVIGKLWTAPFEDYPELNDWWLGKSSKTYQMFLITHPAYFFIRPFQYTNTYNKTIYYYLTPDLHFHEQVVPNKLQVIFTDLFLWFATSFLLLLFFLKLKYKIKVDAEKIFLPFFILLSSFFLYLIIWHADLGELDRHLILCAIMLRIGLIMLLTVFLDSFTKGFQNQYSLTEK